MTITHQDILNRKRQACERHVEADDALKEAFKIEMKAFEAECATIGHLMDPHRLWASCVVCGAHHTTSILDGLPEPLRSLSIGAEP